MLGGAVSLPLGSVVSVGAAIVDSVGATVSVGAVVSVGAAVSVAGSVTGMVVDAVGRGVRVRVLVLVRVLVRELLALVVLPTGTTTGAVVATPSPGCPPTGEVGAPGGLASG